MENLEKNPKKPGKTWKSLCSADVAPVRNPPPHPVRSAATRYLEVNLATGSRKACHGFQKSMSRVPEKHVTGSGKACHGFQKSMPQVLEKHATGSGKPLGIQNRFLDIKHSIFYKIHNVFLITKLFFL